MQFDFYSQARLLLQGLLIVITLLVMGSCRNQSNDIHKILDMYEIKQLPCYDSTNFKNYYQQDVLTAQEREMLHLNEVVGDLELPISIDYWVNLSDNKTAIVVTTQSELEMFTYLVLYTKDFRLMDFARIAYDEVAEGCLSEQSIIDTMGATVFKSNYCTESERVQIDTLRYTFARSND